jgi:hypothetical protein
MTNEQKAMAVCAVLPVIADFIEDLNDEQLFKKIIKQKANMLLLEIRKNDERLLKNTNDQAFAEQVKIQLAFRAWVENNF